MPLENESPIITLSGPGKWKEFSDKGRLFYADPVIHPVKARISDAYSLLNDLDLGVRGPSNREYNIVAQDTEIAEQMREYLIPTGVLKNVRSRWLWPGYRASCIENPEFRKMGDGAEVYGSEKKITLQPEGWFSTEELLESGTGLPQRTCRIDRKPPDEPWAYFKLREGREIPLLRGRIQNVYKDAIMGLQKWEFALTVYYTLQDIISTLGLLAVSDRDPRPKESQPGE